MAKDKKRSELEPDWDCGVRFEVDPDLRNLPLEEQADAMGMSGLFSTFRFGDQYKGLEPFQTMELMTTEDRENRHLGVAMIREVIELPYSEALELHAGLCHTARDVRKSSDKREALTQRLQRLIDRGIHPAETTYVIYLTRMEEHSTLANQDDAKKA